MYPNFHDREYILTDKISYQRGDPQRGDVVVFHAPPPYTSDFIKRIVGMPGETVMVQAGYVYVNGQKLQEMYLPDSYATSEKSFLREGGRIRILEVILLVLEHTGGFS